jgi:hypothetical protein
MRWPSFRCVSSLFHLVFGYVTLDIWVNFADSKPVLNHSLYLTQVASISCVFNAARAIWSALLDRYSYKRVYGTLVCL